MIAACGLPGSPGPVHGFWYRTWQPSPVPPAATNLAIAFSGWADPQTALRNCAPVRDSLPGSPYICLGGGSDSGAWNSDTVGAVTEAIGAGDFAGYQGIAYDIEKGSAGLGAAFLASFQAARESGFRVLATVSHSAPYDVADAAALMQLFITCRDIDILSPQLYTTGEESANDYSTSDRVAWRDYAKAVAVVAPSIVAAGMYQDAQDFFARLGVTPGGFIQWSEGPA